MIISENIEKVKRKALNPAISQALFQIFVIWVSCFIF